MKSRILISLVIISTATAQNYEEFFDGLSISTSAVPLTFTETDNGSTGNRWRIPLDGGTLRFDVSTSGYFDTYINPLSLKPDGKVGIGTSNPFQKFEVRNGNIAIKNEQSSNAQLWLQSRSSAQGDILFLEDGILTALLRLDSDSNGGTFAMQDRVDGGTTRFYINGLGNVGIGTYSPSHLLSVNGTVRAKEVIVDTGWSDFVFEDSYGLKSLDEVEAHIEEHGHLPDVPSASIVESEGLSVGEAQKIMMQKIEELTLYVIDQDKRNSALEAKVRAQQKEIERLKVN